MARQQIIAMGGGALFPIARNDALERYILSATGSERGRVLFVPTASGDDPRYIANFYEVYAGLGARPAHLPFFRRTPVDLRALVLAHDVVHVGGGNTRSMLAVWEDWGLVPILREAWEQGIVLCGSSAGSICWFDEGVTDSLEGELTRMPCLGFVRGSNCPHYDGEKDRRPAYHRLVANGEIRAGVAADDSVGLHYVGDDLHAVVSAREGAAAYRVERDSAGKAVETRLDVKLLRPGGV